MYAQDNNSLPVWIILSPAYHRISINSQPFLVGIVSQDDHDFPDLEVEDDENPGVVDHENEGVEQAGPDVYSIEAEGENQDNVSTETEKDENMTAIKTAGMKKGRKASHNTIFGRTMHDLTNMCTILNKTKERTRHTMRWVTLSLQQLMTHRRKHHRYR